MIKYFDFIINKNLLCGDIKCKGLFVNRYVRMYVFIVILIWVKNKF